MTDFAVLEIDALGAPPDTNEYEGARHGTHASFIVVDMAPGEGVRLHRHRYAEIFIVQVGRARYRVGAETLDVVAPRVIVVAAGVAHGFVNTGSGRLRQVDIHDSPEIVTEWLPDTEDG